MNKKLLLIIAGVAILLMIGIVVISMTSSKNSQPVVENSAPKLQKITDEAVSSPTPNLDGSAIWYFNPEGRLFRVKGDGTELSEFTLPPVGGNLIRALWPKIGSDFLAVFSVKAQSSDNLTTTISYYDSSLKSYTNLSENIRYIDWMPDSKRVVYIWQAADHMHQFLVLANADGTGFRNIAPVFWPDLAVKASPDAKTVLMYRLSASETNKIYSTDVETGLISTLIEEGKNTAASWIDSHRFLYTQAGSSLYPNLYVYDTDSKTSVDLGLATSLDKVIVDNEGKYIYAAVPKPDNTSDTFIKLDLATLKQETIFEPTESLKAKNLFLLGSKVFFINIQDSKLYTISK